MLHGDIGIDILRGNDAAGADDGVQDRFVFDTPLGVAAGVSPNCDEIEMPVFLIGGEAVDDQILLENSIFTALLSTTGSQVGTLRAIDYTEGAGATGNAMTASAGIYNDTTTGQLWYNPTGRVAGDSVMFAVVITGVPNGSATLSADEFLLAEAGRPHRLPHDRWQRRCPRSRAPPHRRTW